jgi:dipeptidyl aminopeptidase/acylaminoacyl peptidase
LPDEKRPITAEDVYKFHYVEDPQISPDGQWIAYVQMNMDKLDNGYKRNIWLMPTDGGKAIQMTRSGKDSSPRWSPDGSMLAFASARNQKSQIYLLRMTAPGGEPRALTNMPNGATNPAWSPDGTRMAFLANMSAEDRAKEDKNEEEVPPSDKFEADQRTAKKEYEEKKRFDPRPMWRIPYRVGTAFMDERYAQVYVMPVEEGLEKDKAKPRRLTNIDANHDQPQWTPDGKHILTGRTIDPERDMPWRWGTVYKINVETGESTQMTDDTHADFNPVVSPDGKWIAYQRIPRERQTERNPRLAIIPVEGGEPRDLTLELDRSVVLYKWAADSSAVLFTANDWGNIEIYGAILGENKVEKVVGGTLEIDAFDINRHGIAYCAGMPTKLPELYWWAGSAPKPTQMTTLNEKFMAEIHIQEPQEMVYQAPDGQQVQGWYLLPLGYEEGKTYPLAFNIHGGPHVQWGPSFKSMWHEWQYHAARGYVVFFANPRGSDGYGEGFASALHAAWGKVAFDDLMAGIDALLEKGFVDKERMAVCGGSYGGYMTAWIVGHTDRFKAAVAQRGVYNLLSFYGTSDVPLLITNEYDVEPWENPALLWEHSPLAYAHHIKTPLLIIHSENDFRVPIAEGEQLFAFVRRSGGTVQMIRYPREGHELTRSGEPEHRISSLNHIVEWFDKYCKKD